MSTNQMVSGALSSTDPHGQKAADRRLREDFVKHLNLKPIFERAQVLARSLDKIIEALQYRSAQITWPDALEQFAVVNLQYQHLMQQLNLQLKHHVAFPKAVNESNAAHLPVLLATKLLPEMEAQEAALAARHAADASHLSLSDQMMRIEAQASHLNSIVSSLTVHEPFNPSSGALDPKGPRRQTTLHHVRTALAPKPAPKLSLQVGQQAEGEAFLAAALGRQRL